MKHQLRSDRIFDNLWVISLLSSEGRKQTRKEKLLTK